MFAINYELNNAQPCHLAQLTGRSCVCYQNEGWNHNHDACNKQQIEILFITYNQIVEKGLENFGFVVKQHARFLITFQRWPKRR